MQYEFWFRLNTFIIVSQNFILVLVTNLEYDNHTFFKESKIRSA